MGPLLLPQWIRSIHGGTRKATAPVGARGIPRRARAGPRAPSRRRPPHGTSSAASGSPQDVRLDADLRNCAGVGLVIAADGVTVDLGGHTIDGTGRGTGIVNGYGGDGRRDVRDPQRRGARLQGGRAQRRPRHRAAAADRGGNATGGVILRGSQCVVERSTITDNGYGHGIFVAVGRRLPDRREPRLPSSRRRHRRRSRSSGNAIEDNRVSLEPPRGHPARRHHALHRRAQHRVRQRDRDLAVRPVELERRAPQLGGRQRHGHRAHLRRARATASSRTRCPASDGGGIRLAETGSSNVVAAQPRDAQRRRRASA